MNDLIRTIAEQTFYCGQLEGDGVYTGQLDLEKFAELIVKECAEQIISKGTDWVDFAPSQTGVRPEYWNMAQQIKQHFGVK